MSWSGSNGAPWLRGGVVGFVARPCHVVLGDGYLLLVVGLGSGRLAPRRGGHGQPQAVAATAHAVATLVIGVARSGGIGPLKALRRGGRRNSAHPRSCMAHPMVRRAPFRRVSSSVVKGRCLAPRAKATREVLGVSDWFLYLPGYYHV